LRGKTKNDMNLFHKNKHITPEEKPLTQAEEHKTPTSLEEWWQVQYGEPMPENVAAHIEQAVKDDARKRTERRDMLTPQALERVKGTLQLAETKIQNIEASLNRANKQLDWFRRYNEKKQELTEHQTRLYEANKQVASIANDERELNRFETFETIQGNFQRLSVYEAMRRANKQAQSELAGELEQANQHTTDLQKMTQQAVDEHQEATNQMNIVRDQLEEANRILGARNILDIDKQSLEKLAAFVIEQKESIALQIQEHQMQIEQLQEEATKQSIRRQTMEPHQRLMKHGEMVLCELDHLAELKQDLEEIKRTIAETQQRQQEENGLLNRVFTDYQRVESDIESLTAELHIHRENNLGRNSYSLQERAMELKSRKQMLISAQSLWNRIASGYQHIETKTQEVNAIRLNIENLERNIGELEPRVESMRQLCHEKEYTLTLSKSQNVIQLRSDLKEGVSCTVCGATHHPYHSDTMLEQSKLIGEMRVDFEILQAELISKEKQLNELRLQYTAETSRKEVEENTLSQLRQRQMEDVKEWRVFSNLDRTFEECSSSTNLDARTTLLRQLIENSEKDADEAQRVLDEYNYHQTRINEISEQLSQKEQNKNDLTLRLNEVNTGCQVMAGSMERLQKRHSELQSQYTRLYEKINKFITLGEWYPEWNRNHESLHMRIGQMMDTWKELNTDIDKKKHEQEVAEAELDKEKSTQEMLEMLALQIREELEKRNSMRKEDEKEYEKLTGNLPVKDYFDIYSNQLQQIIENEYNLREKLQNSSIRMAEMQGMQRELLSQAVSLDAKAVDERSKLDIWMRQFNASHPPVQYTELERAFEVNKDWNITRKEVRGIRINAMLEQTRVDALRSAIVALQAEGSLPAGNENEENVLESLVSQTKQLEKQRQEILMTIAEQQVKLKAHAECIKRIKDEEEKRYVMSDK